MPETHRRGGPQRGVRLTATPAPSVGAPSQPNPATTRVETSDTPRDRSRAVFITCLVLSVLWIIVVIAMKLPGIALAPLLVILVAGGVGISVTRRAANRPAGASSKQKETTMSVPDEVRAPVDTPQVQMSVSTEPAAPQQSKTDKTFTLTGGFVNNIPFAGKRRQRKLAEQERVDNREARIAWLRNEINTLARPRRMYVDGQERRWSALRAKFCFLSVKSSGKTTNSENCASYDASITDGNILLLPMTTVPGDGAMKSGVFDKNTLSLSELFELLPDLKSRKLSSAEFRAMIDQNEYGVYVIAPDFEDDVDRPMTDFLELLEELDNHFDRIYMDGGNNLRGAEEAAARVADQTVFTMFTGIYSTKYMLGKSMDKYASNMFLRSKGVVENSIVTVSGLRPDQRLEDFEQYAVYTYAYSGQETDQRVSQRRFKGRVMKISWDDAIFRQMFCRLETQSRETTLDYLELLYQLFQDAIKRQHSDTDTLESIINAEHKQANDVPFVEDLYDARHTSTQHNGDSSPDMPTTDNLHHIHPGDQPNTQGSLALHEGK